MAKYRARATIVYRAPASAADLTNKTNSNPDVTVNYGDSVDAAKLGWDDDAVKSHLASGHIEEVNERGEVVMSGSPAPSVTVSDKNVSDRTFSDKKGR